MVSHEAKTTIPNASRLPGVPGAKTTIAIVATIASTLASSAIAQTVAIIGTGTSKCSRFNLAVAERPLEEREYFAWAQGYMSGILFSAPPGVDDRLVLNPERLPIVSQLTFLRTFCQRFPDATYSDGTEALYRELGGIAIK